MITALAATFCVCVAMLLLLATLPLLTAFALLLTLLAGGLRSSFVQHDVNPVDRRLTATERLLQIGERINKE